VVVELLKAGADQTKLDDDEMLWWQLAPDKKVRKVLSWPFISLCKLNGAVVIKGK
jgi:hypothetical protein